MLREGEIIRIRSASIDKQAIDSRTLILKTHSNVLKFIQEAKIVTTMDQEVSSETDKDKLILDGDFPRNPVILSKTDDKYRDIQVTKLCDIEFFSEASNSKDYKLCFMVVGHEPKDI